MGTQVAEPSHPKSLAQLSDSFLRDWLDENARQASCATHRHFALIYDNQVDQLNFIVPFLRLGVEGGEKCVYIIDDSRPDEVIAEMERHGIDVQAAKASGVLSIITKHDAYLKNGDFDPDWMIDFLAETVKDAKRQGFKAVRASGEMTWAIGPTGKANGHLLEYECKVDKFFAGHDMSGICQYNRRRFRSETLMHVIHTHPRIIYGGEICENPYYIPTEVQENLESGIGDPVQRLLENMSENTRLRRQLETERQAVRRTEKLIAADRMASTMSHEINNPLAAITNLWYLLNQENLSPSGRSLVETMGIELERISHIAKQTLQFYRADSSKERISVAQVVQDAVKPQSLGIDAQSCSITIDDRATEDVFGFPNELRQLFVNLVTNALEAGSNELRIRISDGYDRGNPKRRGVRIVLADNGCGIPKSETAKAFEPFFTTKKARGTGLGLWVSNGIVRKHEGSISMRSRTGARVHGTTFSIFLPID